MPGCGATYPFGLMGRTMTETRTVAIDFRSFEPYYVQLHARSWSKDLEADAGRGAPGAVRVGAIAPSTRSAAPWWPSAGRPRARGASSSRIKGERHLRDRAQDGHAASSRPHARLVRGDGKAGQWSTGRIAEARDPAGARCRLRPGCSRSGRASPSWQFAPGCAPRGPASPGGPGLHAPTRQFPGPAASMGNDWQGRPVPAAVGTLTRRAVPASGEPGHRWPIGPSVAGRRPPGRAPRGRPRDGACSTRMTAASARCGWSRTCWPVLLVPSPTTPVTTSSLRPHFECR